MLTILLITGCAAPQIEETGSPSQVNTTKQSIGSSLTSANGLTGSLAGRVTLANETTDHSEVTIYLEGTAFTANSAQDGSFLIKNIPVGSYNIIFYKKNYLTERQDTISIESEVEHSIGEIKLFPTPLEVIACNRKDGDLYSSINTEVVVSLNKPVAIESLKRATAKIEGGGKVYNLSTDSYYLYTSTEVNWDLRDSALDYATDYTLTIEGLTGFDGSSMPTPKVIKFRTHSGGPQVVSILPAKHSQNIPLNSKIVIKFDRDMDPATINSSTIRLQISNGGDLDHMAQVSYNPLTREVTITPLTPLYSSTSYRTNLSEYTIKDTNGVSMKDTHGFPYFYHSFQTIHEDITSKFGSWIELIAADNGSPSYVTFDVEAGQKYEVSWDDFSEGSGKYLIDAKVRLYYKDGWNETEVPLIGGGYTTPGTFTATQTGKINLSCDLEWGYYSGLFALKVDKAIK